MQRSKKVFVIVLLILLSLIVGIGICLSFMPNGSKRSDQPVLKPSSFYSINGQWTTELLLEKSDIVVEATVEKVNPVETIAHYPAANSAEAMVLQKDGKSHYDIPVQRIELKVDDYIIGNGEQHIIMPIVSLNLESCPDFKPGDRFVLALNKYQYVGYKNTASVAKMCIRDSFRRQSKT